MRLVVTGFGPFPRMPRNPSAAVAEKLVSSPRLRLLGIEAEAVVLTTAYATLADELDPILADDPDILIMIGVAGRSKQVRFETRATSRCSVLLPDASGEVPSAPIKAGAEGTRRTRVAPVGPARAFRRRHLPARVSRDAGRYLCNAAYFRALVRSRPTIFVHIPKPPKPSRREGRRSRRVGADWERGLVAALAETALLLARRSRAVVARAGFR